MDRHRGFDLASVCWGYRDTFAKTLDGLFEQGALGDDRPGVTDAFFRLMRCSEQQHFDYVLKEFLSSLNPATAWILELPGVFADVTEVGRELAESKLHYGISYFRALGNGDFGSTPSQVRYLLTTLTRLRATDEDLALAFLRGYPTLCARLTQGEIDVYVKQGLRAYHRNVQTGLRFMEGVLTTSDLVMRSLTREARLEDLSVPLKALLRALVGYDVEVADLGRLDSDELIERGTRLVCMSRWLYLPSRVRHFDDVARNRNWYRLCGVVAAGMLSLDSFSRIQGHPAYSTCADLAGEDQLRLNCFQVLEYVRVLRGIRRQWPGARRLLDLGHATELAAHGVSGPADRLFCDLLDAGAPREGVVPRLLSAADASINAFDTVSMLTEELLADVLRAYPGLDAWPLRTFAYLPDWLYPGEVAQPPSDSLVANLKQEAQQRHVAHEEPDDRRTAGAEEDTGERKADEEGSAVAAAYVYDEWSQEEHDYYRDYCHVTEKVPPSRRQGDLPADIVSLAQRTRRTFELLRPELSKEKRLADGDEINVDLLTAYLIQRTQEPSPRVDFYEKPYRNRRDLAVLILLDVSGSTGSQLDRLRTIEVEKRAALVLGHGLASLGDRFAICGFSGNGREQCEFFIYKQFDDTWDRRAIGGVLAAHPRSATRIGAALRHAGHRLSAIAAKQRLILLVTDGKPMDSGYDPATRYAQFDVRMACEENRRRGVHTFCISTHDNSLADMEIMFPQHRYTILPDVTMLPTELARLYVKLTV